MHQPRFARACDLLRSGIGVPGIVQPDVPLEHGVELRGEKASLRLEVPCPLAAIARDIGELLIEEYDRLGAHSAVLDKTETERVGRSDRVPGRAIEERDRIAEPCAVHVQAKPAFAR